MAAKCPTRARSVNSVSMREISIRPSWSAFRITGTSRPRSVSTATPICDLGQLAHALRSPLGHDFGMPGQSPGAEVDQQIGICQVDTGIVFQVLSCQLLAQSHQRAGIDCDMQVKVRGAGKAFHHAPGHDLLDAGERADRPTLRFGHGNP